jgi:predicted DNA-binding transcriptional regulator AlpA
VLTTSKKQRRPRRLIDTMELAARLHCHPMSIPRYVKIKKGFPKPEKPFGKNLWDEEAVEAYLAKVMKRANA